MIIFGMYLWDHLSVGVLVIASVKHRFNDIVQCDRKNLQNGTVFFNNSEYNLFHLLILFYQFYLVHYIIIYLD